MSIEISGFLVPVAILIVILLWKLLRNPSFHPRTLPLPPGPKPLPILGNVLNIPSSLPWVTYADWSAKYGDVMHLQLLGQSIIVLGSPEAAFELLEKRSAIYSDRPRSTLVSLMGWDWNFALMPYGPRWRPTRRTFWQHFHPGVISKYEQTQLHETRRFLRKLLASPDQLTHHIHYAFGATILKAVHGIEVADSDDKYVSLLKQAAQGPAKAFVPGAFWVEYMPILRHIPAWVPGAGFQKKIAKWRADSIALNEVPFQVAKSAFTFSTLHAFFLAMILYPDVQKKAQAELDNLVGATRLPDFGDRPSLIYINAIVKECLRWQNVAPLGVFHRSVADNEYKGYLIPEGSVAFLHDPKVYSMPEEFMPERFIKDGKLNSDIRDPSTIAFGYGRRICPGRNFAESSLFINIATVLHVFDIIPAVGANGETIPVEARMTSGFLSYPVEFTYSIAPRSVAAEGLIRKTSQTKDRA
ncbi:O-methylsterigmatocystin oxidoreductase [Grifola frondosa]|uniref:O-methylsterigmatocystin oxidoreductase n=1 Tax=Grifola frondosa TaxID=5627 RepID=A0A1C7LRY0_GRIFR|nr:O-methylsterigmatocystin oxidoreductase [Grifola frondosa]